MSAKGQGQSLTFVQGHSVFNNFKHLLRNHWTDWSQISCGASMGWLNKIIFRWPPCPCKVKTFKNLLVRNTKVDDLEPWYATSGTRVLPNLFKWWPWVDLDLFYSKVKFAFLRLLYRKFKSLNCRFLRNYWSLCNKTWYIYTLDSRYCIKREQNSGRLHFVTP